MSLSQIRDEYRVPSYPGARVAVGAIGGGLACGTIIGNRDNLIVVQPDSGKRPVALHPDQLTFLGHA